jgi:hypothetical protein
MCPLNNNFYGVYKFITIRTLPSGQSVAQQYPYIVETMTVRDSMQAQAKFYMQGTPLTKVLDIGHTSQEITVKAPILVPYTGNNTIPNTLNPPISDGLKLLNDIINLQYTTAGVPNNALPLMSNASITIGVENSEINFTLKSDGDPNNTVNVFNITSGATATGYITTTGLNNSARVAKNYDFFVAFGDFQFFIEEAVVDIKIDTTEKNFLGAYPENYVVPTDGTNGGVYQGDTSYSGWQFPFIAVGGVEITAKGRAMISIDSSGNFTNFKLDPAIIPSDVDALRLASNVTLQKTGQLDLATNSFNIYYTGNSTYTSVIPSLFNISKAVVTMRNANFSKDIMTADFEVRAWSGY